LKKVDNRQFIEAWQTSETVQQVCDTTGLKKGSAYSRAFRLRQLGVNLKKMTTKNQREARELIQLAEQLA
jgi:hypothetical protein